MFSGKLNFNFPSVQLYSTNFVPEGCGKVFLLGLFGFAEALGDALAEALGDALGDTLGLGLLAGAEQDIKETDNINNKIFFIKILYRSNVIIL
jgi:hypothetical protein